MQSILIKVLDQAIILLDKRTPQTKLEIKSVDIRDISPLEIVSFMKENNIPNDAFFDGEYNGYDGWAPGIILLSWEIDVPTTEKERLRYKRKSFDSRSLKLFKDTTVYDMYINKEFDRLVEYYSMYFRLS